MSQFELVKAGEAIKHSVAIAEKDPDGEVGVVGRCRAGLGFWHYLSGDNETAVAVLRMSIAEMESSLPPQHADMQGTLAGLRDILLNLGREDEAKEVGRRITLGFLSPAGKAP